MGNCAYFIRLSLDKLLQISNDMEWFDDLYSDDYRSKKIDIDKSWHAIHFLLTGTSLEGKGESPARWVVFGDHFSIVVENGDECDPFTYMYLLPDQVKAVANFLTPITREILREKFDPSQLSKNSIYPIIWKRDGYESFNYIANNFEKLVKFYQTAAKEDECVIAYLA